MEVGTSTVRLAEVMKRGRIVEVLQTHVFDMPDDATRDGKVRISESVVSAIRNGIDGSGIKATDVYFVVESTKILFKSVEIPQVTKKQIQSTLEFSFEDYFPVDKTLYHVSYVHKKTYEKNGQRVMLLDVFAIPNDLSESYYNLAVNLGLNAKGLTDTSRSMISLFPSSFRNRNVAMININESTSTLCVAVDGEMIYNKTIPHGIGAAMQHVINSPLTNGDEGVTDAVGHLYTNNILFKQMPAGIVNQNDDTEKLRYNVTSSVVSLVKTIEQNFVAFLSKENIQIQEFHLSGLGAGFAGISHLLASEFSIPVTVMQMEDNLRINNAAADEALLVSCYPCVGGALDTMNFFTKDERAGGEITHRKQVDRICMFVGSLACLACFGYGSFIWLQSNLALQDATAENVRITKRVDDLRSLGVEEAYNDYMTALSYNEEVAKLYNNTRSGNEDMVVFLEELERIIPKSARVTAITLTPTKANVAFVCDDKFVASGVLHLLRNMKTTNNMECPGVAESLKTSEISFTCDFSLKTTAQREEEKRLEEEANGGATEPDAPIEDDVIVDEPVDERVYLIDTIENNTDADLSTFTMDEVPVDIRTLTTEILTTNGFSTDNNMRLFESDAAALAGFMYQNQAGVMMTVVGDNQVEAMIIENPDISFYNGLRVGMTLDEAFEAIGDETITDINGCIILKNAENTLVLHTDFDGMFIEYIYLINNETADIPVEDQIVDVEDDVTGEVEGEIENEEDVVGDEVENEEVPN